MIQLKSKLKLQKNLIRNQRERVKILEAAYREDNFEAYFLRAIEQMDEEIKRYDTVFEDIMMQLNVEVEVWKNSTDYYFQSHGMMQSDSYDIEKEMHNIERCNLESNLS